MNYVKYSLMEFEHYSKIITIVKHFAVKLNLEINLLNYPFICYFIFFSLLNVNNYLISN